MRVRKTHAHEKEGCTVLIWIRLKRRIERDVERQKRERKHEAREVWEREHSQ